MIKTRQSSHFLNGLLDSMYGILFHPATTMAALACEESLPFGLSVFWIAFVSGLAPFIQLAIQGGTPTFLWLAVPLSILSGLVSWGFVSILIAGLAYAFRQPFYLEKLLTLSGFSTIPWVLMGFTLLFKASLAGWGTILFVLFSLIIWLWTVILYSMAIGKTYQMHAGQVLIVLAMPFGMSVIWMAWLVGFIGNIQQLVSP
jgi:hypothetical protein